MEDCIAYLRKHPSHRDWSVRDLSKKVGIASHETWNTAKKELESED